MSIDNITLDVSLLYKTTGTAKLSLLDIYIRETVDKAGNGNYVTITGEAPVWLYLKIAHALHGRAARLTYRSPVTGDIVIFDHSPL